jgi:hypothetical protein
MTHKEHEEHILHWINEEIPLYLTKFSSFEDFNKDMPSACASIRWKEFAYAMAKIKWNIDEIKTIPR